MKYLPYMLSSSLWYEKLCWQVFSVLASVFILPLSCEVPYQKQSVSSLAGRYWQLEKNQNQYFSELKQNFFRVFSPLLDQEWKKDEC